ncbi:hypothetical protein [Stieleria mannarensis]|uniref:hypothetical protein n=1 Tax=Stieleria mannarensis TaxID=2755585 RepID=UPI001600C488|nr:hypothetical protein [Rhodopirellula sp. JC639]
MNEQLELVRDRDPALLHRGLGALIGSIYGGCSVAFLAFVLLASAIEVGVLDWLNIGGPYPEIAIVYLPILALPSGILGGLICGATQGRRLGAALSLALVIPLLFLLSGVYFSRDLLEVSFFAATLFVCVVASTVGCHLLVNSIVRRRQAVIRTLQVDATAKPGTPAAMLNVAFSIVAFILVMEMGQTSAGLAGLIAGMTTCGLLASLHLLSAYPNHFRTGAATTAGFVATLVYLLALHGGVWI